MQRDITATKAGAILRIMRAVDAGELTQQQFRFALDLVPDE